MSETTDCDGLDLALNADSIKKLLAEKNNQHNEIKGRLDAAHQEIAKKNAEIAKLRDPNNLSEQVKSRIRLLNQCQEIIGDSEALESMSDQELKILTIKKRYPDLELKDKEQSYIEGIFDSLARKITRSDSLGETRKAMHNDTHDNAAYEKWLSYSAKLWSLPLAGSLDGARSCK